MKPQQPVKKSNKKLYIIIGLVILLPIILVSVITFAIIGGVLVGSKSTYEYKCAIIEVKKNEKAIEMLGEPMEESFYILPNIEIKNSRREVNFSTSLSGPKGSGTLRVSSFRDPFRSDFMMQLEVDDDKEVLYKGRYPCED
ncbi:MAG: hypothetical protein HKN33_10480 [Pyrinomonadaceae bacterium]|nr:hypothetical protein [Pyrinomonadaceae bacterium]